MLKSLLITILFIFQLSPPKHGIAYNPERIKRGIPVIEKEWILYETDTIDRRELRILYQPAGPRRRPYSGPVHEKKFLFFKDDTLSAEEDFYVKQYDDRKYKLLLSYSYKTNDWGSIGLAETTEANGKKQTRENGITLSQADSTLASWGLSRTAKLK
jgi:hypothetical protein